MPPIPEGERHHRISRLIGKIQSQDPRGTGRHVCRVSAFSEVLYREWASQHNRPAHETASRVPLLRVAAMLHDVGKTELPAHLIQKPGPLDAREQQILRTHPVLGARLFGPPESPLEVAIVDVMLNHHERWDGTGYPGHVDPMTGLPTADKALPDGSPRPKRGEEIPLFGRIVSIADIYDALLFPRAYKPAWLKKDALRIILAESGKGLDPALVRIFLEKQDCFERIRKRHAHPG